MGRNLMYGLGCPLASLLPVSQLRVVGSKQVSFSPLQRRSSSYLADDIGDGNIMRKLAPLLSTYLFGRNCGISGGFRRRFSSINSGDELSIEEEAERKIGWLLKLFFAGTAAFVGYQFFPYMGDNLMQQSVSLLQVKDPLFKRMGASRLSRFAIDDERRMKIVEIGGAKELLKMLEGAKDDRTRMEALKALVAISRSDEAVGALYKAGAIKVISSTPDSFDDAVFNGYKSTLIRRFQDLSYVSNLETDQSG